MIETILIRLREVLDEVHVLASTFRFTSSNRQHLLAGALLGRILEETEGIFVTLERRDSACGFILLRSLLEAYIDLRNTVADTSYGEFMQAAFLDQQRRLLEAAVERGGISPFLSGLASNPEVATQLSSVRSQLEELRQRGVSRLSIRARFERAGQIDYYEGPYSNLCWHSHNNINVLENRHLQVVDDIHEIRAFAPMLGTDAQLIADTSAGIAANSIVGISNLLGAEQKTSLDSLTKKLAHFRELWLNSSME